MTYNNFLDTWFGSGWLSYGIPILLFSLYFIYSVGRYIKWANSGNQINDARIKTHSRKKMGILIGIAVVVAIALIVITIYSFNKNNWGYGRPAGIADVQYANGKVYVMDFLQSGGSASKFGYYVPPKYYRLHVVNAETGDKKIRFRIGTDLALLSVHGDSVRISRGSEISYYSGSDGRRMVTYSKETLPSLFSQFSSGIESFTWYLNHDGALMQAVTPDGAKWILNTATGNVSRSDAKAPVENIPATEFYLDDKCIRVGGKSNTSGSVYLCIKGHDEPQSHIYDSRDSIMLKELAFVYGRPVAIDLKDNSFVVLHYQTTKKEQIILTCISLDGRKILWELKQSDLNPDFMLRSTHHDVVSISFDEDQGKMFFNIDCEIFAVYMKDGKVLWRHTL
jgi:hypothetical protein